MGWTAKESGFDFSLLHSTRLALGSTQPSIQWVQKDLYPWVIWLVCEAHCSTPSSAEVKNMRIYSSTPPYVFMAWFIIKCRDNFALYYAALILGKFKYEVSKCKLIENIHLPVFYFKQNILETGFCLHLRIQSPKCF
jgi:hypothetical protein